MTAFPSMNSKPLITLSATELINIYGNLLDIKSYLENVDSVSLHEEANGLLQWFPTILGDSKFYELLSSGVTHYYPIHKQEFVEALKLINGSSFVLEFGCGQGSFGQLLSPDRWFGVDINRKAIETAKAKGLRCQLWDLHIDSLDDLPVSGPDVVCSFQTIEHMADPSQLFRVAAKLLGPNGTLIIGAPSHDSILGMHPLNPLNLPPHHQTWWTDRALISFPLQFGFQCSDLIHCPVDKFHQKWVVSSLLRDASSACFCKMSYLKKRVMFRIRELILRTYFAYFFDEVNDIDSRYGLRGQSVLAVYKKTIVQGDLPA